MAYTGRLQTGLHAGLKMTFDYEYAVDKNRRVAELKWSVTPMPYDDPEEDRGNAHYHLAKNEQKFVIKWADSNGKEQSYKYNKGDSYTNDGHTVYRGYTDAGSWLDKNYNGREFYDTNGNWTGVQRWVKILGTDWLHGSCVIPYSIDGEASFYVKGDFAWWSPVSPFKRMVFEKTIKLVSIPKAYRIKYDANGGSGAPDSQLKVSGTSLTLSSKKPTLSGFTFKGWGTSATDTTPNYQPGSKYTKNEKATLYAVWGHNVTYDANGGKIANPPNTQTKFSKINLTLFGSSKVSRSGYLLNGWSTSKLSPSTGTVKIDGSSVYSAGGSLSNNSVTTLYAYWRYKNVTITLKNYYENNVKVSDKTVNVLYDHIPDSTKFIGYSREGYELLGWSTQNLSTFMETPSNLNQLLFDYTAKYTSNPDGLVLYPILKYSTTCYVYDNGEWKLAIPYVYDGNMWKQSIMYGYDNNSWKL